MTAKANFDSGSGEIHHAVPPDPKGEVWVWLSRDAEGVITPGGLECLHEGGALARRLGAALVAVSDRTPDHGERNLLAGWGVLRLRMLDATQPPHPAIHKGNSPFRALLNAAAPIAALLPADSYGLAAAPLLAAELNAEYLSGIQGITTERKGKGQGIVAVRSVLGGQTEQLIRCSLPLEPGVLHRVERPVVATMLPGSVGEPRPPQPGSPADMGSIMEMVSPVEEPDLEAGIPPLIPPDPATVDLEDAERIVAFGRGAFTPKGKELAQRLADALGAVVAGTRPAADEGWLSFSRQVGLTGAIVRPLLYVALGISGAPYHMVGIKNPETLVAINTDPEAPILAHSDLAIVGDLFTVVPALLERLARGKTLGNLIVSENKGGKP